MKRASLLGVAAVAAAVAGACAEELLLTEASVWRSYMTFMPGLIQLEQGTKPAKFHRNLTECSALPPSNWMQPDFDDTIWSLWRQPHTVGTLKLGKGGLPAADGEDTGVRLYEPGQYGLYASPCVGLRCFRGRFNVENPAAVGNLTLSVEFRGGLVVYLNGTELGRAYLPSEGPVEFTALAEGYPAEVRVDLNEEQKKNRQKDTERG